MLITNTRPLRRITRQFLSLTLSVFKEFTIFIPYPLFLSQKVLHPIYNLGKVKQNHGVRKKECHFPVFSLERGNFVRYLLQRTPSFAYFLALSFTTYGAKIKGAGSLLPLVCSTTSIERPLRRQSQFGLFRCLRQGQSEQNRPI